MEYLDIISSRNLLLEVHTHPSINLWSCINFYRSNRISISWDRRENRFPCWPRKWCQEPQRRLLEVLVASQIACMIVWCPETSKMVVGQLRHHTTCRPVSDNELWCNRIPWLLVIWCRYDTRMLIQIHSTCLINMMRLSTALMKSGAASYHQKPWDSVTHVITVDCQRGT